MREKGSRLHLDALARIHDAARVRQARRGAEHDRRPEALAELESGADQLPCLGGVGRLEQRDLGDLGEVAAVLLVLRRVHAGIVGYQHDEAGVGPGVGKDHERIGGDVEADVLHRHHGAEAAERSAHPLLERHLLVGGPVGVHFRVLGKSFQHLGAGSAGVSRGKGNTGLPGAPRDRLVARHQCCHDLPPHLGRDLELAVVSNIESSLSAWPGGCEHVQRDLDWPERKKPQPLRTLPSSQG